MGYDTDYRCKSYAYLTFYYALPIQLNNVIYKQYIYR